ncbi:hypothetical protein NLG97_g10991 [Lecanicillium saksenae]|uniref:Uncharacterized protein n=1 Tax=Lecanicillium saksenae TaxID=468837 RepID=A0ACC1QDG6_9HYPO|nr:hypothetical protein NLG97_g10991 [Lecanicillium saksenae]
MSPATARLAYAARAARSVDRTSTEAVKKFADDWLVPLDDAAAQAGSEGGPLGIWPWGLSLADVVSMSKAHGVVEDLTRRLVDTALPQCEGLFGTRRADYARATPAEVARIHRVLYGYEIYCGLLFRDAGDCKANLSWRTEVNFQLSAALYHDNVVKANNQLACIHDFLENIVMQAFKQVAMYDVAWGAHEVDYLSTGSANEHVQAYLSLGLDYIYKLAQANTLLPPNATADDQLQQFHKLRSMLLTHRYSSISELPPRTSYMLASELNAHSRAHLAKTGAGERQHACHLWDEPSAPPSADDVEMRCFLVNGWAAEGERREKEVEEKHRPAMKRSWARRKGMYSQGGNLLLERQNVGQRADGRDGERVDVGVAAGVVPLDVLKLRRVLEGGNGPVQVAHPLVDGGVAGANVPDVALEVLDVDGVETDERDIAVPLLGLAKVVGALLLLLEVLLRTVERLEEGNDVALVGLGRGREPGLVDAVVDEVVLPLVRLLDVVAEGLGVDVDALVLVVQEVVKLGAEDAQDLAALVLGSDSK